MTLHTARVPVKMALPMSDAATKPDPYAPWRSRDYRCYACSWFLMAFSRRVEFVAVSVYLVSALQSSRRVLRLGDDGPGAGAAVHACWPSRAGNWPIASIAAA